MAGHLTPQRLRLSESEYGQEHHDDEQHGAVVAGGANAAEDQQDLTIAECMKM